VAALLALLSAVCFGLSAALRQRGQFTLARSGAAVKAVAGHRDTPMPVGETPPTDTPFADPAPT
jgi:hypothetical protein